MTSELIWFAFMMAAGAWVMIMGIVIHKIQQDSKISRIDSTLKDMDRRIGHLDHRISMSDEERELLRNVGNGPEHTVEQRVETTESSAWHINEEAYNELLTALSIRGITPEQVSRMLSNFNENMMPELEMLQEEPDHEPITPENIKRRSRKINHKK